VFESCDSCAATELVRATAWRDQLSWAESVERELSSGGGAFYGFTYRESSVRAQICNLLAEQPKNSPTASSDGQRDIIDFAALTMQLSDPPVNVFFNCAIWNLQVIAAEVVTQCRRGAFSEDLAEFRVRSALGGHPDTSPSEFSDYFLSRFTTHYLNEGLEQRPPRNSSLPIQLPRIKHPYSTQGMTV
jgi:hypothetical protein